MVPLEHYFILATLMFVCGTLGVLFRRNLLFIFMSIELMLNAVNLVLVAASRHLGNLDGQIMVCFVITLAACEAGVGLAMVIAVYRRYGTIEPNFLRVLRG